MDTNPSKKRQTFIVEVTDYQKHAWQGQICWIQEDKKVPFRSVMEMLKIMDSALTEENGDDWREEGNP